MASFLLLGVLLGPVLDLVQSSAREAAFDEFQVLARRQAGRALSTLATLSLPELRARADAPTRALPEDPRVAPDSLELRLPLPPGPDVLLDGLADEDADVALDRLARTRVFYQPLAPGLARLTAHVWWPAGRSRRSLVVARLVEDPLRIRGGP